MGRYHEWRVRRQYLCQSAVLITGLAVLSLTAVQVPLPDSCTHHWAGCTLTHSCTGTAGAVSDVPIPVTGLVALLLSTVSMYSIFSAKYPVPVQCVHSHAQRTGTASAVV